MKSVNRLSGLREFEKFNSSSQEVEQRNIESEQLEEYISQSEELIAVHNWLGSITVFPGSCIEFASAYGYEVEPIGFDKVGGLKGLFLEPKKFRIYDINSDKKLESPNPPFPYKEHVLYTLPGINCIANLKKVGFTALVNAQFHPTKYSQESHESMSDLGAFWGLPVRRADFVGRE